MIKKKYPPNTVSHQCKLKVLCLQQTSRFNARYSSVAALNLPARLRFLESICSFTINDGDGSNKRHLKNEFALFQNFLHLFQFAENVKCRRIFQELISWGTQPSLGKETKIKRFKLSTFKSQSCSDDKEMYKKV